MRGFLGRVFGKSAGRPVAISVEIDRERASAAVAEITESQFFRTLEAAKLKKGEPTPESA
ncbi:MAG: hypothetical protein F2842_00760 [Actinobacteria bacterium]|uniref:Unannotated protein n=1 Tax=freshwater metagenome TaxID=449393 RepID=A0A6J7IFB2_9ZZZZ|nr:hypothetical protein [Actinomycetota bacterium]MSW40722.1 hypothetical protein [Actinomycetota bacterium]